MRFADEIPDLGKDMNHLVMIHTQIVKDIRQLGINAGDNPALLTNCFEGSNWRIFPISARVERRSDGEPNTGKTRKNLDIMLI